MKYFFLLYTEFNRLCSKIYFAVHFFLISTIGVAGGIPLDEKSRDYDQIHIKLSLHFDIPRGKVFGNEEFSFVPLKDDFTVLRLHSLDTEVRSVSFKGNRLKYEFRDSVLHIYFPETLKHGEFTTLAIEYIAEPGAGLYFFSPDSSNPDTPVQIWSQGQGNDNRHWFPAYDLPDDRHTTEMAITVPGSLQAYANGLLKSVSADKNTHTYYWQMEHSHANYLTTLVVGDYRILCDTVLGIALEYALPQDWTKQAETIFGRTPEMLRFLSDEIAPYPYRRYAQFPVQDFLYGGMENVTATTLNRRILHKPSARPNYSSDDLIAHEFAHQWFGDMLTCNTWADIWLNEGFATYFTNSFAEHMHGRDEGDIRGLQNMEGYKKWLAAEGKKLEAREGRGVPAALQGEQAYSGGASVLRMLRFELGDSVFLKGIREYARKYAHTNVSTDAFRSVMEEISGQNLNTFFEQWVFSAGFPTLNIRSQYDSAGHELKLHVQQTDSTHPGRLYAFGLPMRISFGMYVLDTTLQVSRQNEIFTLPSSNRPEFLSANVRSAVLCDIQINQSTDQLTAQACNDDDMTGRYRAVEKLSELGAMTDRLRMYILRNEPAFQIRQKALELTQANPVINDTVFMLGFRDKDARVRETAFRTAARSASGYAVRIILAEYDTEENEYVKAAMAYAGTVRNLWRSDSMLSIESRKRTHRQIVLRSILEGLQEIKNPGALPFLPGFVKYDAAGGDMHQLSQAALDYAEVFFDTYPDIVTELFCGALENPYFRTRMSAAGCLARHNAKDSRVRLEKILFLERRHRVRSALRNAISKLSD